MIEVRLYATLRSLIPEAPKGVLTANLPEESTVEGLLREIKVDPEAIHMLMVNGVSSSFELVLKEGDRVGLFPPVGGG
ncbi:MAG: MoaD/ThiS family protein [Pelosinus sp.]|nr:MoaD/ThiS family protein [Pelosinus sp.]